MCRGNAKIKPRASSYPPQCVLLLCCFKCDGSFLSLTDRQGTGWDRISCLLKLHILNDVGLKLETKNPAQQHFFSFYINISVCIFLSVCVLFLFSFICTLPPLAHHWQEIGGPLFFSYFPCEAGRVASVSSPTKRVQCVLYISDLQHTDFLPDTGKDLQ